WIWCTASSTTMPSVISVVYSRKSPARPSPPQIRNVAVLSRPPLPRRAEASSALLILVDDPLQLGRHLRNRLTRDRHLATAALANDEVQPPPALDFLRTVFAKMRAPALFSLEARTGDRLRHGEEVGQVERRVPAGVVFTIAAHSDARRAIAEAGQQVERPQHVALVAHDPDEILHALLQLHLNLVRSFAGSASRRPQRP